MPVLCVCRVCSRPFTVKPSVLTAGKGKYCSPGCHDAARRKPPNASCEVCGALFHISPSREAHKWGRYCSNGCRESQAAMDIRFWSKVAPCTHGHECPYCCWLWTGALQLTGYGVIERQKSLYAHRVAWELWHNRPVPVGLVICHYCHCRLCCNPMHLHAGTSQDNMDDSVRDGRMPHGEASAIHILSTQDVLDIRAQHAAGVSMYRLHKIYGIHKSHVRDIVRRKTWKHVP